MKIIERIIQEAKANGACNLIDKVSDLQSLCALFFTPQGREYCINNNFPDMAAFRQLKAIHCSYFNVFCDSGRVNVQGGTNYAAVGETRLQAKFNGADELHTIILMHGATAEIEVTNYAVVKIEKTPDCKVHVINDNTGIVLW